jgi:hypothetical protein
MVPGFGQAAKTAGTKPETATIHVYRPKAVLKGRGLHPSIYFDGVELHRLHQGMFFVASIPSGKHMITVGRSEAGQFIDFEPGKQYYFRFGHKNILVTALSNRQPITLSLVSADEAESEIHDLKEIQ